MDWEESGISERLPARSAGLGCSPCLQRPSVPQVELRRRILPGPKASGEAVVSHQSRPCAENMASKLRTNHEKAPRTRKMYSAFPFASRFAQMPQKRMPGWIQEL